MMMKMKMLTSKLMMLTLMRTSGLDFINFPTKNSEINEKLPAAAINDVPAALPKTMYCSANAKMDPHIAENPAPRNMLATQRTSFDVEPNTRRAMFEQRTTV